MKVVFRELNIEDKRLANDLSTFLSLYVSAFPSNERRREWMSVEAVARFLEVNVSEFHVIIAEAGSRFTGFLTYWDFGDFVYVEHLTVEKEFRGQGIGGQLIKYLAEHVNDKIILEVELPATEIAKRREEFYNRMEFRGWSNIRYVQPAYSAEQSEVPLMLMTHGEIYLCGENDEVVKTLKRKVYGVKL